MDTEESQNRKSANHQWSNTTLDLSDKRIQVTATFLVAVFGFIVTFLTISISFGVGFERTLTWAVIVGLLGWIVAEQVVRRKNPRITSPAQSTQPTQGTSGASGFSCLKCGKMEILAPPDGVYIFAKLEPCIQGDSKRMNWKCRRCDEMNVIYWDTYHPYIGAVRVR